MFQAPYMRVPQTQKLIPAIGLGTFGSDHVGPQEIAQAVRYAITIGYRHIDCASVYGNESYIGKVLAQLCSEGVVKREDLWITTKLWNDAHGKKAAKESLYRSLEDLSLDYVDAFLIHWPYANYHPPHCSIDSRNPHARPYDHELYMNTWQALEELHKENVVQHIGSSNMTVHKLQLLLQDALIPPACNEMELHPHFQQPQLFRFCKEHNILPIGYSPLGSPRRPDRDRSLLDSVDMEDPVILSIAKTHQVHPASICLKWALAHGHVSIPFSTKEKNIRSNIEAVCSDPLTEEELAQIDAIDRNCRLIKGHVFLWEGATDWQDLWDNEA